MKPTPTDIRKARDSLFRVLWAMLYAEDEEEWFLMLLDVLDDEDETLMFCVEILSSIAALVEGIVETHTEGLDDFDQKAFAASQLENLISGDEDYG